MVLDQPTDKGLGKKLGGPVLDLQGQTGDFGDVNTTKHRLAIIDLDDTLLGENKQVSPQNREALAQLRAAGYQIVVGSGRHHLNIVRFEDQVGSMDWVISSQGAVIRHAGTDELVHEFTVPLPEARALLHTGRAEGFAVFVYHRDGVFAEEESEWSRLYASRAGWTPQIADLAALVETGVQKVLFSASGERVAQFVPEMEREYGTRLYMVVTDPETFEFLSPRANKGLAAATLARKLGIDRRDVVAFGDGNNDVEMLAWAGFSVAMAHGRQSAQQAASRVSPPGRPETAFARAAGLVLARD